MILKKVTKNITDNKNKNITDNKSKNITDNTTKNLFAIHCFIV